MGGHEGEKASVLPVQPDTAGGEHEHADGRKAEIGVQEEFGYADRGVDLPRGPAYRGQQGGRGGDDHHVLQCHRRHQSDGEGPDVVDAEGGHLAALHDRYAGPGPADEVDQEEGESAAADAYVEDRDRDLPVTQPLNCRTGQGDSQGDPVRPAHFEGQPGKNASKHVVTDDLCERDGERRG